MRVVDTPPGHEISSSRLDAPVHRAWAETAPPPAAANDAESDGGSIEICPGYARVAVLVGLAAPLDPAVLVGLATVLVDVGADHAGRSPGSVLGDRLPAASTRRPGMRVAEPAAVDCDVPFCVARSRLVECTGTVEPVTSGRAAWELMGDRGSRVPAPRSAWALGAARVPGGCELAPLGPVVRAVTPVRWRSATGLLRPAPAESEVTSAMSASATASTAHARDPRRSSAIARHVDPMPSGCARPSSGAARARLPSPCERTRRARAIHARTR